MTKLTYSTRAYGLFDRIRNYHLDADADYYEKQMLQDELQDLIMESDVLGELCDEDPILALCVEKRLDEMMKEDSE